MPHAIQISNSNTDLQNIASEKAYITAADPPGIEKLGSVGEGT